MPTTAADRDLLFGLLALQNDLIDRDQLVEAFRAWAREKTRPLAEHLVARGALDADQRSAVSALVTLHVKKHGGHPERSLAAVPVGPSIRQSLAAVADPEVHATLGHIASGCTDDGDPHRTATLSVGAATSEGQRFQILRPHARGGLGAVFVARDGELNREVALKQILDHHADDPTSRARFVLEAEITGGLEHPGVVPVYGLGSYSDGRPYYAMRFIRGDSLKAAIPAFHAAEDLKCDLGRRSLALRKLLRRFLDVCNAIDYAHSRGVLHRDIKPANVILGKHGETLVVDWGLAKLLGRADVGAVSEERMLVPSLSSGSAETLPGSALGTPAYMSPEQASGDLDRLGPHSDVYSLGATLYCLLTGKPAVENDDVGTALRAVQKGAFPLPRQLAPSIDRALEAICLKAMALRPEDRYPSPHALAEDLERWMADEPVTARRDSPAARLQRWARRNRTAVTAAAVALLVALAGTAAVLAVQTNANGNLRAANLRLAIASAKTTKANADLKAANERETARFTLAMDAVKLFHGEVSKDLLLKEKQFEQLRTKLLRGAAGFYGKLEDLLAGHSDWQSRTALGHAYSELGELTAAIGSKSEALAVFHKALAVRRELAAEPGTDTSVEVDLVRNLLDVGLLQQATGDVTRAQASFEEARGRAESLASTISPDETLRSLLALSHHRIGGLLIHVGEKAPALRSYERAIAIRQELVHTHPDVSDFQNDLASSVGELGMLFRRTGRPAEGLAAMQRAINVQQKLADAHPENAKLQSELAQSLADISMVLNSSNKPRDALVLNQQAVAIRTRLADANRGVTRFQSDLAEAHDQTGYLLQVVGKPAEALAAMQRSRAIRRKLVDSNPDVIQFQLDVAQSHNNTGWVLKQMGKPAEALQSVTQAIVILQRLTGANPEVTEPHEALAMNYEFLGGLLQHAGRCAEAVAALRKAVVIWERLPTRRPNAYYNQCCAHALLAGLSAEPASEMTAAEGQAEAVKAMLLLRRAVDAGYRKFSYIRTDPDLNALRSRPDFRHLIMDLEFPADPFAP
jgi:serine/threonine-protein kinase